MNQDARNIPAAIGAPIRGGFFSGLFVDGPDTFALVVAPKAEGETTGVWSPRHDNVTGAQNYSDGLVNTTAMAEAGSAIATWARSLEIDGFDDWYIPSRDELELMYRNLKPTDQENYCTYRDGENPSSVPVGYPYTEQSPQQTRVAAFMAGGEQALAPEAYWSSTQYAGVSDYAWYQYFYLGTQLYYHKSCEFRVRAVRRFKI